jgi:hypothetical protein
MIRSTIASAPLRGVRATPSLKAFEGAVRSTQNDLAVAPFHFSKKAIGIECPANNLMGQNVILTGNIIYERLRAAFNANSYCRLHMRSIANYATM